jgi:hypothetical protein
MKGKNIVAQNYILDSLRSNDEPLWKKIWRLLKNLNIELPYDPAIPLLGIYPKDCDNRLLQRHLNTHVYCGTIHNNQVMETAKMPHY